MTTLVKGTSRVSKARAMVIVPVLDPDTHIYRLRDAYAFAVNYAIRAGVEHSVTSLGALSRLVYHPLRKRIGMKSIYVASAIKHAVGLLRSWRKRKRKGIKVEDIPIFKGSVVRLHKQVHRVDLRLGVLTISTARGRRAYRIGLTKQVQKYVYWRRKESLLIFRDDNVFLALVFERDVDIIEPQDVIGVDVNENNITVAVSSALIRFDTHEREIRTVYWIKRRKVQSEIRAGKRREVLLRKYGKRERERMKQVYHKVATEIVRIAFETRSAVALENLKHIKRRIHYTREMTGRLHRWGARLFQRILEEKAQRAGVVVVYVNPAHTSSLCPICGHKLKDSPKGQRVRMCPACGFTADRDVIGAVNIRLRGIQKMGGLTLCPDRPPMNSEVGIVRPDVVVDVLHLGRNWALTTALGKDRQVARSTIVIEPKGGGCPV